MDQECSDIHISCDEHPVIRKLGELEKMTTLPLLKPADVDDIIKKIVNEDQYAKYQDNIEIDLSIEMSHGHRCRINIFKNTKGGAIAIRPISNKPKTLAQIKAPKVFEELLNKRQGLVIVSGPTGCGKTTTLSAMVNHINNNYKCNIITIEDPIEYLHKSNKSLINQREIGTHSKSFPCALRSSLREDPDIILIGEMRDLETISLALTAAETGHLVLATLHNSTSANAISRIIDVFHESEQQNARSMLANSLNAVVLQHLLPTTDSKMEAAFEVLIANSSIKNLIREDKLAQISSMIEIGKKFGMITFEESIKNMLEKNIIDKNTSQDFLKKF